VLTVHLGYDDQELRTITSGKHDWWDAPWRESDMKVVSSPDFQQFLKNQGFTLVTWKQVAKAQHSSNTANP
jgi:DNA polymerase III psi subunit